MRLLQKQLVAALILATMYAPTPNVWATAMAADRFDCGGEVEDEVYSLWKNNVRAYLERSMQDRLISMGDVYVLYDLQTYTHNLLSMARRCGRTELIMDIARIVRVSFGALQTPGLVSPDRRWICRGGKTCTYRNGLLGSEVMLCSVQFLGLAVSVANALASSQQSLDREQRAFVQEVSDIVEEHLRRWGDAKATKALDALVKARPGDVQGTSSKLLFTDRSLWMISIYAEWAGLLDASRAHLGEARSRISATRELSAHVNGLLRLFNARISQGTAWVNGNTAVPVADIDGGFWTYFSDNRYAAYEGEQKPLVCPSTASTGGVNPDASSNTGNTTPKLLVAATKSTMSDKLGWDISHARRLVHALDALQRNRTALTWVFKVDEANIPQANVTDAFAGAMIARVWNGDKHHPLFRNYLSGANGWYRVGYSPAGGCNEGKPPYGLGESFLTGGYASWGTYRPLISQLGHRLYDLMNSSNAGDKAFVARYYEQFGSAARPLNRALSEIMFLPSLVGIRKQ
ncbi:hypothetical protein [Noviherbaspirillum sp. Root189]|uniref:hypothetical protein n=1 Tax=Noviherbaspirillum sp. Root189 TaxID=1736487 RepID=UPI00070BBAF5|nr:hypothetical protein [Noviherbaspirillum sp. Root189]KRB91444.1 hypothetical protein ASE07_16435 [Noviherbaspirillum sp. Root189]